MNATEVSSYKALVDEFSEHMETMGSPDTTIRAYRSDLALLGAWLIANDKMPADPKDAPTMEPLIAEYLNEHRAGWKPKTTRRRLGTFRRCWGYFDAYPLLRGYRAPHPARPEPHPLPGGISDVLRMTAVAPTDRHRALVALCGLCGLRVSEARTVTPNDYNVRDRVLTVHGKGARERVVPVSELAASIIDRACTLEAWTRPDEPIVDLADRSARDALTEFGRRAGIDRPVKSHDLRATYATAVYEATKDIRAVQELLGHADINQTQVYVGTKFEDLRAATNKVV